MHVLCPDFSSHESPSKRASDFNTQEGASTSSKEPLSFSSEKLDCLQGGIEAGFLHEMEVNTEHVLSSSVHLEQSPASSAYHSPEEHVGWAKSTPKIMGSMEDHTLSVNEDPYATGEASVKGSGFSATNYSDLGAVDDGGLAFTASDTGFGSGNQLSLRCSKSHQLYTLRRNPKPSKRFEDQELAMEMGASAVARKSSKEHQCIECGKEFVSSRALAGHMRCHPEREWRGIHCTKRKDLFFDSKLKRPQSSSSSQLHGSPCQSENQMPKFDFDNNQSDSESIEAAYMNGKFKSKFDIENQSDAESIEAAYMNGEFKSKFDFENQSDAESIEAAYMKGKFKSNCRNWMTGKRSKRSHQTGRPLQADPPLKSELESQPTAGTVKENKGMADWLVMLAYAGKIQEHESAREATPLGLSDWERSKYITDDGAAQPKGGMEWNRSIRSPKVGRQESNQSADQKEAMQLDPGEIDGKFQIECNICKRVFKSRQALGGHRASHKKVKGCFARAHDSERGSYSPKEDLTEEDVPTHREPNFRIHAQRIPINDQDEIAKTKHTNKPKFNPIQRIKPHECSICHKCFQSGQALGGHKRCHWGGTASLETSFSQEQHLERNGKGKISREELLDHHLPAPDDTILDLKIASTSNHMQLLKSRSRLNHHSTYENHPLRLISLGDDAHHTESRASSKNKLLRIASSCDEKLQAAQEVASATQNSMLDDHADALAFTPWYVQHNICDKVSSSIANLSNHQRNHTSTMGSVAGLTPISA